MVSKSNKQKAKSVIKWVGIVFLSLLLLIIGLALSLQIPAVQNVAKDKLVSYLQKNIGTEVQLDKIAVDFPRNIVLNNLYLEGQDVDTLLYAERAEIGLNMLDLLNNKASFQFIDLDGIRANIVKNEEGGFNFDYITNSFSKPSDPKPKKESKPFEISLDKIELNDIALSYNDLQGGSNLQASFHQFNTTIKKFNLQDNSYGFSTIKLDGLRLALDQEAGEEIARETEQTVDSISQNSPLQLNFAGFDLTDIQILYDDNVSDTYADITFEELIADVNTIDLSANNYELQNFELSDADMEINLRIPEGNTDNSNEQQTTSPALHFALNRSVLENIQLEYNNTAVAPQSSGVDFNHLTIRDFNAELNDLEVEGSNYKGSIERASFSEKSGLNLRALQTHFVYNNQQIQLNDLYVETPRTVLRNRFQMTYESPEQLSSNLGNVGIQANLNNSRIGFADILLLAPQLRNTAPFTDYPNEIVSVDANVDGTVNQLTINKLYASGFNGTVINVSGTLNNAMQPEQLRYNLTIDQAKSTAATLQSLIPAGTIPENIQLPEEFSVEGRAEGSTKVINANLNAQTTSGNLIADAEIDMTTKGAEKYNVNAQATDLNIGKIIQDTTIGQFSGTIVANGTGFQPQNATTDFKGNIASLGYNNYIYQSVDLEGSLNNGEYQIELQSEDENAELNLFANGVYTEESPSLQLNGSINQLDVQALNFTDQMLIFAGDINGDFSNIKPNELNGELTLNNFAVSNREDIYPLEEIHLRAVSTIDSNALYLNSQVADIQMQGDYQLTQIATVLQQTVNEYYQFRKPLADSILNAIEPGQYFTFSGEIYNDSLLHKFAPGLTDFEPITLYGSFNADRDQLNVEASIPQLTYQDYTINSGQFNLINTGDALEYELSIAQAGNENLSIYEVTVDGLVADNGLSFELESLEQETNETDYLVGGRVNLENNITTVSLDEEVILNGQSWSANNSNSITYSNTGLLIEDFILQNANHELSIQSETEMAGSPLNVNIQDFEVTTLTDFVNLDKELVQGTINGTATLRNVITDLSFESDLEVSDMKLYDTDIGTLNANVNAETIELFNVDIALSGQQNDLTLTGTYEAKTSELNMDLNVQKMQLQVAQAFSFGALQEADGYLSGNVDVTGTVQAPRLNGSLGFTNGEFLITQLGTKFQNINDDIQFTDNGIELSNFSVADTKGNDLVIDGTIGTTTYQDYNFDLTVEGDGFRVVDTEKDGDNMLYGVMAVDADFVVSGNLELPKVSGTMRVTDETNFSFILPQTSPAIQSREGVVEFVDFSQTELKETIVEDTISTNSGISGLDVSVNIAVDEEALVSIIIDQANGDFIELRGEGQLTGGVDPSGKTTLVGTYEVSDGAYELSLGPLNRRFDITDGSTIIWEGDPLDATMNITAVYETEAAPVDLLSQQLAGLSSAEYNQYKERVPISVQLSMQGELLNPDITFNITADENANNVSDQVMNNLLAKLRQIRQEEAQMNKQVFSLLLLNRFIGENPFQSESGLSAEGFARQSVSRLLSQQLNNLAGDLIEGVDLNLNLESTEDYSSGERTMRTDLNVDLSKSLLNDRLTVKVGSDFGLEGEARANEQTTNFAGDVSVEYALSEDGRYILRAYRKNEYQIALQGQVIETGVAFVITLDYNEFSDIFERKKQNKNIKQQQKSEDDEGNQ